MPAASARLITPSDAAAVTVLREAALEEVATMRGGTLYPARPLPDPDDRERPLWVGEFAGAVVGYLAASRSGPLGAVDALYVDPGCRAVGVGRAMMDAAVAWLCSVGCTGVDALALPGARATKNFFEDFGLTARLLVVHRRL